MSKSPLISFTAFLASAFLPHHTKSYLYTCLYLVHPRRPRRQFMTQFTMILLCHCLSISHSFLSCSDRISYMLTPMNSQRRQFRDVGKINLRT
ncbi:hypothetical protein B0H11DRAFT_1993640, partial [Mycena galericulata]